MWRGEGAHQTVDFTGITKAGQKFSFYRAQLASSRHSLPAAGAPTRSWPTPRPLPMKMPSEWLSLGGSKTNWAI